DQLPRLVAGRVGEGRAAGAGADRLACLARGLDLIHALSDHGRITRGADEFRADEDPIRRRRACPVVETKDGGGDLMAAAPAVERDGAAEQSLDVASI